MTDLSDVAKQEIERWKTNRDEYEYRAALHRSEDYFKKWSDSEATIDAIKALHTRRGVICGTCGQGWPCQTMVIIDPTLTPPLTTWEASIEFCDDPDVMPWPEALGGMHG